MRRIDADIESFVGQLDLRDDFYLLDARMLAAARDGFGRFGGQQGNADRIPEFYMGCRLHE